jgi:hypothetical protein
MQMRHVFRSAAAALLGAALVFPALSGESKKFEKTVPFQSDSTNLGIAFEKVTIESVRVRNWPDPDDFAKAEKDLNDKHTMVIEFTYSNRDLDNDYKCRYLVTIPGADGAMAGENDRTATLDKGKVGDTNKMFVKMRTNDYKTAKTMKISFEIWRKS